ncbi:MAG: hypothetical protein RUMPE_00700 [Eubacteriales bacterium SKADARSKE-1]|nr:hypothetical protein [Eubacteriales bacterium SKADARSKE-1]
MLRAAGITVLLISSVFTGIYISHRLSLRVEFLRKYLNFIKYIETEIRYSADLIYDLVKKYKATGIMKKFVDECCCNMEKGIPVSSAWNLALKKISADSGLYSDDIEIIHSFGENLGKNDIEGQIAHCNLTSELIGSCLICAKDNKSRKSKLYFMLCLFSGLCIILLFL